MRWARTSREPVTTDRVLRVFNSDNQEGNVEVVWVPRFMVVKVVSPVRADDGTVLDPEPELVLVSEL